MVSHHQIEVNGKNLTTKNILVSTGASPFVPSIPGLDKANFSTSDSIWELRSLPKHLVVIGGGPIGCELVQAFRRLRSEVTILTRDSRILPKEDLDFSELVLNHFEQEGIGLHQNVRIDRIEKISSTNRLFFKKIGWIRRSMQIIFS